jgi:hypothetical protein
MTEARVGGTPRPLKRIRLAIDRMGSWGIAGIFVWTAVAVLVTVLLLALQDQVKRDSRRTIDAAGMREAATEAFYRRHRGDSPVSALEYKTGATIEAWSFEDSVPRGWDAYRTVRMTDTALRVVDDSRPGYAFTSKPLRLAARPMRVVARLRIESGGVAVYAIDIARNRVLGVGRYSAEGTGRRRFAGAIDFDAPGPGRPVGIALQRWAPTSMPITWEVSEVRVQEAPPSAGGK